MFFIVFVLTKLIVHVYISICQLQNHYGNFRKYYKIGPPILLHIYLLVYVSFKWNCECTHIGNITGDNKRQLHAEYA